MGWRQISDGDVSRETNVNLNTESDIRFILLIIIDMHHLHTPTHNISLPLIFNFLKTLIYNYDFSGRILTTPMNLFGNSRSPEMVFSASHWGTARILST